MGQFLYKNDTPWSVCGGISFIQASASLFHFPVELKIWNRCSVSLVWFVFPTNSILPDAYLTGGWCGDLITYAVDYSIMMRYYFLTQKKLNLWFEKGKKIIYMKWWNKAKIILQIMNFGYLADQDMTHKLWGPALPRWILILLLTAAQQWTYIS